MDNDSIKRNIQQIRIGHNMSQEDMAKVLGVTRNAYHNIEKGSTKLVSDTVFKIADWAGISPEEVILGHTPYGKTASMIKDANEQSNNRLNAVKDDYEKRLGQMKREIELLKAVIQGKDDNLSTLKSYVSLLESKQ